MNIQHKTLTPTKWSAMSLAEQLGNVGSEFERALLWKKRANPEHFEKAFDRLLELLDLTLADSRWYGHRLKELTRLRGAVCYELTNKDIQPTSAGLQKYFLQFALLARIDK